MVRFLFFTAWSAVTTTDYRRRFTGNPPTLTDSLTNNLTSHKADLNEMRATGL